MELIIEAAAACVIGAVLALTIQKGAPEIGVLVVLGTAAVVLLPTAAALQTIIQTIQLFIENSGVAEELFIPLYKTIGIALVVQVGGGLCKDAGGNALATVVEIVGTVCALLAALPLLQTVLSMLLKWL